MLHLGSESSRCHVLLIGQVLDLRSEGYSRNKDCERNNSMKITAFLAIILCLLTTGCSTDRVYAGPTPTLQQQVAAGGIVSLPAGTIDIDCSGQVVISKTTTLVGQGRGLTVINDSCATGDTFLVDVTNPA